jgi:iron complex outermembrane receptor protein
MFKSIFVAFTTLTIATTSAPLLAQDREPDEVVVTVRKTEENLQDVPLSVTSISSETLGLASVQQLSDVANLTPGLIFQDFNVGALSTPVIRGLAQSNIQGRENNVGMFLDGIYLPNRNNLDLELLELARVEVVKGPQSALYGRSTFAGSINYVTKEPSDEFDLKVSGSLGTDEYLDSQLNLTGPITDTLSGTFALGYREFDGTINNAASGDNLGGYENTSVMGKLLWEPTDNLSASLLTFITDKKIDSAGVYNLDPNCGATPPSLFSPGGAPTYTCGDLPFRQNVSVDPLARGGEADTTLVSLEVEYDFGEVTLTSITAYTDSEWDAITDYDANADGVAYATFDSMGVPIGVTNLNNLFFNSSEDETYSQELRLDGGNDTFSWLAGGYWTTEENEGTSAITLDSTNLPPGATVAPGFLNALLTPTPLVPNTLANQSTQDVDIFAVFARGQWDINDRSRLSLEGRYTWEDKDVNGILSFFGAPSGVQSNDWDYFAPRLTYDFDLTDDVLMYGSIAQGVKSGGFNTSFSLLFPEEQFYDEETNTTLEVGSKGTLAEGRLRYDVAVFYVDWEDLQIAGASLDPMLVSSIVRNSGSASSQGLELQVDGYVTDWMDAGFGYAYADPEFDSGVIDLAISSLCGDGTLCTTSVGGQQVGRTVKHQFNMYADFHQELSNDWRWYARADYIFRGESPTRSANLQFIDDYTIVNARVGLANEHWDVALWAKNLFDEGHVTSQIRQPRLNDFVSPTTVIESNKRQVALTVAYRL